MKDELVGKILIEFIGLRAKTYSCYLINDGSEDKKAKGVKSYVIKIKLRFEDFKNCLDVTQLDNKIKQLWEIKLMWLVLKKIITNS